VAVAAHNPVPRERHLRGHRSRGGLRLGDPHPGLLPNAKLVVDHFHLVKLANDAVTKVRRRVTWELRDRRGRELDPEWATAAS
jgi:hypothetical protein